MSDIGHALAAYLDERSIPEPNSGCLLWTAGCYQGGHASAKWQGRYQGAHRLAWKAAKGEIPSGLHVCHKCDVRSCINPDHLFLGTQRDNNTDRSRKGRSARLFGEDNPFSRLTAAEVAQIRMDGRSQRKIAATYGISKSQVANIKHGRQWPVVA